MICLYTSFSNTSEGETYFVVYTLLSANKKYMYKTTARLSVSLINEARNWNNWHNFLLHVSNTVSRDQDMLCYVMELCQIIRCNRPILNCVYSLFVSHSTIMSHVHNTFIDKYSLYNTNPYI